MRKSVIPVHIRIYTLKMDLTHEFMAFLAKLLTFRPIFLIYLSCFNYSCIVANMSSWVLITYLSLQLCNYHSITTPNSSPLKRLRNQAVRCMIGMVSNRVNGLQNW